MSISPEQKKIRLEELRIGQRAAKTVEAFVHSKIGRNLRIRNKGSIDKATGKKIKPILEATRVRAKTGTHRLLGLNFTSNKYGFIHHFGVPESKRATHNVQRTTPKTTFFQRKEHPFMLKKKSLFEDIYEQSGALDILADGLSETRTDAVIIKIKETVVQLNHQKNV